MAKKETLLSVLKEIRDCFKSSSSVVKGALKEGRFVDNGDGTITDTKTDLIWAKNPHTDLPDAFKKEMVWKDAIQACKNLNFAGHKDWHLPTVKELASLFDYNKYNPAIDKDSFPDTKSSWYWTSTPYAGGSSCAWFVAFYYGLVDTSNTDNTNYVRPVRSSQ